MRRKTITLDYNGLGGGTYNITINANTWYRAVFIHRTARANDLYINGVFIGTVTMSQDMNLYGNRMDVGNEGYNGGASYFNGYIKNMIIENGNRDAETIAKDYGYFPNA